MYVDDIVAYTRSTYLDDTVKPYLWSDESLEALVLEAQREACERADLIINRTDYNFDTVANQAEYTFDPDVIRIIKMETTYNNFNYPIERETFGASNYYNTYGLPSKYFYIDDNTIRMFPIPDKIYNIQVAASVYPKDDTKLEIPEGMQYSLALYVAGMAFLNADVDTFDETKAKAFLTVFESKFGSQRSAKALKRNKLSANSDMLNSNAKKFGFP